MVAAGARYVNQALKDGHPVSGPWKLDKLVAI